MNTTTNTRGVSEAMVERMAAARWEVSRATPWDKVQPEVRQDEIAQMRAALDVVSAQAALSAEPAAQPEDSRCPPTYRREEAVKALIGKGWTWDGKAWAEPAAQGEAEAPSIEAAEAMGAKGGPAVEAERLAFEAWLKGHCWTLNATWRDGAYRSDAEQGGKLCPHAMQTRGLWAAWRDRAALAAPPAQPAERVPDGWKLVPIDATPAMQAAGGHANSEWLNDNAPIGESRYGGPVMRSVWEAMLAASPAPSEGGKGVEFCSVCRKPFGPTETRVGTGDGTMRANNGRGSFAHRHCYEAAAQQAAR